MVENARSSLPASGFGRKVAFRASARSASRSSPPSAAILREASSVAHIRARRRGSLPAGSSNFSRALDVTTTCHG